MWLLCKFGIHRFQLVAVTRPGRYYYKKYQCKCCNELKTKRVDASKLDLDMFS